jgi:hypothetical protein
VFIALGRFRWFGVPGLGFGAIVWVFIAFGRFRRRLGGSGEGLARGGRGRPAWTWGAFRAQRAAPQDHEIGKRCGHKSMSIGWQCFKPQAQNLLSKPKSRTIHDNQNMF